MIKRNLIAIVILTLACSCGQVDSQLAKLKGKDKKIAELERQVESL